MKSVLLLIILLSGFGFTHVVRKAFLPPGTSKVNDTLFADRAEISNFAWWEYEYSMKIKFGTGSKEHLAVLPDTSVWLKGLIPNEKLFKAYYRSPKYKEHPVVGISYEQALSFCKWRTEMVKLFYARTYHKGLKFCYRLPHREEWEMIAQMDNWKIRDSSQSLLNRSSTSISSSASAPSNIYSYKKNPFGLYNLIGNVSEMISEKGLAKGGSWTHEAEKARTGKNQEYSGPQNWLGFRCVAVISGS